MTTTNGNADPGAKTDLVDQVGELEPSHSVGRQEPVKKAVAKKTTAKKK